MITQICLHLTVEGRPASRFKELWVVEQQGGFLILCVELGDVNSVILSSNVTLILSNKTGAKLLPSYVTLILSYKTGAHLARSAIVRS